MGEERLNLGLAHLCGMTLVVEEYVLENPVDIRPLCALGVVFDSNLVSDLIHEFPWLLSVAHMSTPSVEA